MTANAPSIYPSLLYRDANAAVEWLERAFGFEKLMVVPGENGGISHAELKLGNGVVLLGSFRDTPASSGSQEIGAAPMSLYAVVENLDAHYKNAMTAGAEIVLELETKDYGGSGYTCRDLEGYLWSFGTYVPDMQGASSG